MRKDLNEVVEKHLHEALTLLGYTKCQKDGSEWRRQQFHLFLQKKKRRVSIHIHEDVPHLFPPFHRARQRGKALAQELRKIVEAYRRRRALAYGKATLRS